MTWKHLLAAVGGSMLGVFIHDVLLARYHRPINNVITPVFAVVLAAAGSVMLVHGLQRPGGGETRKDQVMELAATVAMLTMAGFLIYIGGRM